MLERVGWGMPLAPPPSRRWCLATALGLHAAVILALLLPAPPLVPPALTSMPLTEAILLDMAPAMLPIDRPAAAMESGRNEAVAESGPAPIAESVPEPAPDAVPESVVQTPPDPQPDPLPIEPAVAPPELPPPVAAPPDTPPPPLGPPVARPPAARPATTRPVLRGLVTRPTAAPQPRTSEASVAPAGSPIAAPSTQSGPTPMPVGSNAVPNWRGELMARLLRAKQYPPGARSRGEQGTAYATFTMDRDGHVLSAALARESGSYLLDAETVALIRRAEPLPPFPAEMTGATITLTVPVVFTLR